MKQEHNPGDLKLLGPPQFLAFCLSHALRHPRAPIQYWECCSCGARFVMETNNCADPTGLQPKACPKCGVRP